MADNHQLRQDEFTGIINVISDYTYALDILDKYDHQNLKKGRVNKKSEYKINYEDTVDVINNLKKKFGGSSLFGKEKDQSLKSTWALYIRLSIKRNCTIVLKKLLCCFTLQLKIIHLSMEIKESRQHCFLCFLTGTTIFIRKTEKKGLPTTPWLLCV